MYLIDTYALIEWFVEGSKNYERYFENINRESGFVTELTILEFYHRVFHKANKEKADEVLNIVLGNLKVIDLNVELIIEAAMFRSHMLRRKKDVSYADSVNYVAAKHLGVKLLTGDEAFRGMESVEFVK